MQAAEETSIFLSLCDGGTFERGKIAARLFGDSTDDSASNNKT
jgi:hypothetical protein